MNVTDVKNKSLNIGEKIEVKKYHKIQTVYKRDSSVPGKIKPLIEGQYSIPEFEYLATNTWVWTEKIHGANIRVIWDHEIERVKFRGKTDDAQIPTILYERLEDLLPAEKFKSVFPGYSACLYGEGLSKGIGWTSKYTSNEPSIVLFDVKVDIWWLERENVEDISNKLDISITPILGEGNLSSAIEVTRNGFNSTWGDFIAEGLVMRPKVELQTRGGERIITKVKYKDFIR